MHHSFIANDALFGKLPYRTLSYLVYRCIDVFSKSNFYRVLYHQYSITNQSESMLNRAVTIRLSSDMIRIAIHAMRYDTYHDISQLIQPHLGALFPVVY